MLCASESQCELIYHIWYFGRWFDLKGLFFSIANGLIISILSLIINYLITNYLLIVFFLIYPILNIILVIIMEYFQAMLELRVSVSCFTF